MIAVQVGICTSFNRSTKNLQEYYVECDASCSRVNLRWLEEWLFADMVTDGYSREIDPKREVNYKQIRMESLGELNWTVWLKDLHSFL